ncbi:hypothetical protein [Granulicella sp. dw_53]|uniref:hypothetical protein n=1 Tax=Granulicella sp. dw_53 TaxID=2719792 RepID=UPI001BD6B870|nr:hypothetical protein [Granulicella sp. dw_53]
MRRLVAMLILATPIALAQAPPSTLQLSPQAAYNQAVTPIEITHRSMVNWSDIETAALTAAIHQAKEACLARTSATFSGDDLIAFARLCALGQQWPTTLTAATTYINSADTSKPQLAQAYSFQISANLNLNDEKSALGASIAMLQAIPYGPLCDEVTTTVIRYLQIAFTSDALTLHSIRQPILLRLLKSPQPPAAIPLHTLFEHALDFAALELYVNQPRLAAGILSDLDAAAPSDMAPDDALPIADARRQYALLGTRFPSIPGAINLISATPTPFNQPNFGSAAIFLLFPPWCAQCLRETQEMIPAISRLGSSDVHIYGLLADNPPPARPQTPTPPNRARRAVPQTIPDQNPSSAVASGSPKSPVEQLLGTPTLVVSPSTVTNFAATDFPFLVATDHEGIIRLLLPAAPENALTSGGTVDQIAAHILTEWPPAPQP